MRFKGKTILVTGGAGFIDSAVVRYLPDDTRLRREHRQADLCRKPGFDSPGAGASPLRFRQGRHLQWPCIEHLI